MTTYGVTSTGFVAKTTADVVSDLETNELENIDPTLDLSPTEPLGQLNGAFAEQLAQLWELAAAVYASFDPNASEDVSLDNVCSITGTTRTAAKPSTVTCNMTLGASKTVPAGTVVNVLNQESIRFVLQEDVTSTTAGVYPGAFASEQLGPIVANAGTLTVITTPVSGFTAVTNPTDAVLGNLADSDTVLRTRREQELTAAGASTLDSLRADLLELPGMQQVFVFENTSLYVDSNGLPGKSFECIVFDGTTPQVADADIAQTIWNGKPSGMQSYGTSAATATDSQGTQRIVNFTRASVVNVYLAYTVTTTSDYPADGNTQVKAAAAARAASVLSLGTSVVALAFRSVPLEEAGGVAGVIDVPNLALGFSASPTATANLTIGARQIASVDTSRITVNGS